jgi:hypothetical protein
MVVIWSIIEAMNAMHDGKQVSNLTWLPSDYIEYNSSGHIVDDGGNRVVVADLPSSEWFDVSEQEECEVTLEVVTLKIPKGIEESYKEGRAELVIGQMAYNNELRVSDITKKE